MKLIKFSAIIGAMLSVLAGLWLARNNGLLTASARGR
jgi:hypothetical protein